MQYAVAAACMPARMCSSEARQRPNLYPARVTMRSSFNLVQRFVPAYRKCLV